MTKYTAGSRAWPGTCRGRLRIASASASTSPTLQAKVRCGGPTQNDPTGTLTDTGTALQARAKEIRARLLIVDPRAAAYAGDENHRAQVRSFVSCWDRWAREHRCAVLLVDHLPKTASTRPGNRDEPSYSGSTDWHNAARSRWTLDEDKNGSLLRCEKSNYGSAPGLVRLSNRDGCAWFAAGTTENSRKSKFI